MKKAFNWFLLTAILSMPVLVACDKNEDTNNDTQAYTANATGAQAVPSNSSTASAQFNGSFNKNTKNFSGTVSYSGVTPTNIYIQRGTATVLGTVVLNIGAAVSSPVSFTATLDASAEAELSSGTYYLVITSAAYPNGEIRGQLVAQN